MFIYWIVFKIQGKITGPWNIGHSDLYLFWGQTSGHTDSQSHIRMLVFEILGENHWTMKYRSQWPTFILRWNVGSYWFTIPNKDVQTLNSLQDIRQNHWNMKYRSQWPTFILRWNIGSYWFTIPNKDVHTSNSLQDIRQKSLDHEI